MPHQATMKTQDQHWQDKLRWPSACVIPKDLSPVDQTNTSPQMYLRPIRCFQVITNVINVCYLENVCLKSYMAGWPTLSSLLSPLKKVLCGDVCLDSLFWVNLALIVHYSNCEQTVQQCRITVMSEQCVTNGNDLLGDPKTWILAKSLKRNSTREREFMT